MSRPGATTAGSVSLPYQPGLDGLRALAVLAVVLYHSGYTWAGGGFLGVDLFFVLSGFLITSLLLAEWRAHATISLGGFYRRRARRLLPALFALLFGVVAVAAIVLPDELGRLRGEVPAALTYVTNIYLIVHQQSYFQALGRPSPLEHLWSLAVEEQYYLLWPLMLLFLLRLTGGRRALLLGLISLGILFSAGEMAVLFQPYGDPSRVYYGTDTRAATLLVGSALAVIWDPAHHLAVLRRGRSLALETVTVLGLGLLGFYVVATNAYDDFLYRGGFVLVAITAAVVIAAVTHPAARIGRRLIGHPILRWFGVRSYAIYLWHWPLFTITRPGFDTALDGLPLLGARLLATVALADLSYRLVERPVRGGALGRWWARLRGSEGAGQRAARNTALMQVGALGLVVVILGQALWTAGPTPELEGIPGLARQPTTTDDLGVGPTPSLSASLGPTVGPTGSPASVAGAAWRLPVRLLLVGDSQANMLVLNAPTSVARTFSLADGWVEGCGVLLGEMRSRIGYRRDLDVDCAGWSAHWRGAAAASHPQIALVVLGAWDVFDLVVGGQSLSFGTPAWDAYYTRQLASGIAILRATGVQVALLEVPCYRPIASSAGPVLPERADDGRTRHVDTLLEAAAAADPLHVFAVVPPTQFCTDPKIATDVYYRWDGVHYGRLGAALVFAAITPQLLKIPPRPTVLSASQP